VVKVSHHRYRNDGNGRTNPLDGHRPNLFGLRLRVAFETRRLCRKEDLERVDPLSVRRDGHDGDNAASEAFRGGVGAIVTDNHGGPSVACLGTPHRIEIHETDLAAVHLVPKPIVARGVPKLSVVARRPVSPGVFVCGAKLGRVEETHSAMQDG